MVADGLNRGEHGSLKFIPAEERPSAMEFQALANRFVRLDIFEPRRVLTCVLALSSLFEWSVCVPNVDGLRVLILEEAHNLKCSIHLDLMKMYHNLKHDYLWKKMKEDIVGHISRCLNFQQVKYEHQKPDGLTQRLPLPPSLAGVHPVFHVSLLQKYHEDDLNFSTVKLDENLAY
ncbi:uncharacterized protein [Nicotiana tomentosiformis]|uniref:uncharacterized protein n=1 Tax=Nicotiana tomentosiformis TaxID=4098 RepID=UPI00388C4B7C